MIFYYFTSTLSPEIFSPFIIYLAVSVFKRWLSTREYDSSVNVFIPKNCTKTLAEMTDYERNNRPDNRTDASLEFINWLNNEYKKEYQKIK